MPIQRTVNSYALNPESAKQAGQGMRIDKKGAYVGKFTRAEAVVSQHGTEGIEFSFRGPDGAADFLTLWAYNADKKELYGRKVIDAIMTCLSLREIKVVRGRVKKYDSNSRQEEVMEADLFPDMMGKDIGLFLVVEEYEKTDKTVAEKMVIVGAFEAATNRLPAEILSKSPNAKMFLKVVESLRDRPLKQPSGARLRPSGNGSSGQSAGAKHGFDDMDDDFPF